MKYAFIGVFIFGGISGGLLSLNITGTTLNLLWTLVAEVIVVVLLTAATIGFMFYRNPERIPPEGKNIIVSPADSKILYIKEIKRGEIPFSKKKGKKCTLEEFTKTDFLHNGQAYQIGILMNYLDVHVVRSPINGHIHFIKHIPGKFISLKKIEAIFTNERMITIIENSSIKVAVVQIASRMVRRIAAYVKVGQEVNIGERIGIIKFGSQVDLLIPRAPGINIHVRPGDKVKAGITIIADYEG